MQQQGSKTVAGVGGRHGMLPVEQLKTTALQRCNNNNNNREIRRGLGEGGGRDRNAHVIILDLVYVHVP